MNKPAQVNVVLPRFELVHIGFAPPVASADVTHDLVVYGSDGSKQGSLVEVASAALHQRMNSAATP